MRKFLTLIILSLIAVSCDAPHENPLDPENRDSRLSSISGSVETISLPRIALAGANVIWKNENISAISDARGKYELEISKIRNGWLLCRKDGYFADSVYLKWADDENKIIFFYLNKKPSLADFAIKSNVVFISDTAQSQTLTIDAVVEDRDHDIDSVFCRSDAVNFSTHLNYNIAAGHWNKTVSTFETGVTSFEQLEGKPFTVTVKDYDGRKTVCGEGYISRLITTMPVPVLPREDQAVSVPFDLTWESFPRNFDFYYNVQIYRNEIPAQLVYEAKEIDKNVTSVTVEGDLPVGNYVWMLSVIDEFGNKVRSKPQPFKIGE